MIIDISSIVGNVIDIHDIFIIDCEGSKIENKLFIMLRLLEMF